MFEVTAFETRRRIRWTLLLTLFVVAFTGLVVGLFPSIAESGIDFEAYVQSFPPEVQNAFLGSVETIGTIEGFLVTELYQFVWVLILGVYFGYAASTTIANEAESKSLDLLLTYPVSRTRIVVGKFLALLPTILFVNAVGFLAVATGVALIDEHVDLAQLFLLHALFLVYHAASASVGMVSSVLVMRVRAAQAVSIAVLFSSYLVDSISLDTDYEWLGTLSLSRYFDAGEILLEQSVDWGGIGILLIATVVLVVLSAELFERRDISG